MNVENDNGSDQKTMLTNTIWTQQTLWTLRTQGVEHRPTL